MRGVPDDDVGDETGVVDALAVARARLHHGDITDAVRWVRLAAAAAFEANNDLRGIALSKAALELVEEPLPLVSSKPPPLPKVPVVPSVPSVPPVPTVPTVPTKPPPLPSSRPMPVMASPAELSSGRDSKREPPLPTAAKVVNRTPRTAASEKREAPARQRPKGAKAVAREPGRAVIAREPHGVVGDDGEATRVSRSPFIDGAIAPFARDESTTLPGVVLGPSVTTGTGRSLEARRVNQALRVVLRRDGERVTVRLAESEGVMPGEHEVMLVALDADTDVLKILLGEKSV